MLQSGDSSCFHCGFGLLRLILFQSGYSSCFHCGFSLLRLICCNLAIAVASNVDLVYSG